MSSTGMTWARQQTAGNPTAKAVLLLLGELVGDDGVTTRSHAQLAAILECRRETIGRAIIHLEDSGLLRRDRRQAGDSRRLPDRITLAVDGPFTVTPLPEDTTEPDPETAADPASADTECAKNERSNIAPMEGANIAHMEGANIAQSINSSLTSSQTSLGEPALFEAPPSTAIAVPENRPEAVIAKRAYDGSKGALKYAAIQALAKEALKHDYTPQQVDQAIGALWHAGRAVTAQTLGQYLQGIINPAGNRPKPSTTDQRVAEGLALRDQLRAMEAAQK